MGEFPWRPGPVAKAANFLRAIVFSESFAWAASNATGMLFAMLFVVASRLEFIISYLACMAPLIYTAACLVTCPNRSTGGRIMSSAIWVAMVPAAVAVGGAVVSLAFLAKGDSQGLITYLPSTLQFVPDAAQVARLKHLVASVAQMTALALPPSLAADVRRLLGALAEPAQEALLADVHMVGDGFWVLLMVLPAVVLVPLSMARAHPNFAVGTLVMVATVFMGVQIATGPLMAITGVELFWRDVVVGWMEALLVCAASVAISGLVVFVQSSHDLVRQEMAAALQGLGLKLSSTATLLSGFASGAVPDPFPERALPLFPEDEALPGAEKDVPLEAAERYRTRLHAQVAAPQQTQVMHKGGGDSALTVGLPAAGGPTPAPSMLSLRAKVVEMRMALLTSAFEPPLPGLCSQPGASVFKYKELRDRIDRLVSSVSTLETAASPAQLAQLRRAELVPEALALELGAAAGGALALAAAACAGASAALGHMPPLRRCAGAALRWRPLPSSAWADVAAQLAGVQEHWEAAAQQRLPGLDMALSLRMASGGWVLFLITLCRQVATAAQELELSAADALDIDLSAAATAIVSGSTATAGDDEAKTGGDADGDVGVNGAADTAKTDAASGAGLPDASIVVVDPSAGIKPGDAPRRRWRRLGSGLAVMGPDGVVNPIGSTPLPNAGDKPAEPPAPSSFKEKALGFLSRHPTLLSVLLFFAFGSGLVSFAVVTAIFAKNLMRFPVLLRSKEERAKLAHSPSARFALKYWLATSLMVVATILVQWKGGYALGANAVQGSARIVGWIQDWSPPSALVTLTICLQPGVESTSFRSWLRAGGTAVGGAIGYATMLNGPLANSAYFITGITCAVLFLFSLLAPINKLRYALFMLAFGYVFVAVCQYVGCCGVAGSVHAFYGKVVTTTIGSLTAVFVSTVLWPNFTSREMLSTQASVLSAAAALLARSYDAVGAACAGGAAAFVPEWEEELEARVQEPIGRVEESLRLSSIDWHQMPLTGLLVLPTPQIVGALQPSLASLAGRLDASLASLGGGAYKEVDAPAPSAYCKAFFARLDGEMRAVLEKAAALAEACGGAMGGSGGGGGLPAALERTRALSLELEDARVALWLHIRRGHLDLLADVGTPHAEDFRYQAWLHAATGVIDEIMSIANILGSGGALQRRDGVCSCVL